MLALGNDDDDDDDDDELRYHGKPVSQYLRCRYVTVQSGIRSTHQLYADSPRR